MNVLIEPDSCTLVEFSKVKAGDVFVIEDEPWLKTMNDALCVSLSSGQTMNPDPTRMVRPIRNAQLRLTI